MLRRAPLWSGGYIAERTMILCVGRTVVYALAKQLNKEWDQKAVEIASLPESLSMVKFSEFESDAVSVQIRQESVAARECYCPHAVRGGIFCAFVEKMQSSGGSPSISNNLRNEAVLSLAM